MSKRAVANGQKTKKALALKNCVIGILNKSKALSCGIALFVALMAFSSQALAIDISAGGAVLMEAGSGKVLYAKNADAKLPMASTTKIMTALLAVEHGNLDELIATADEAYGIEGSSIYLNKGERLSLNDLLYGLMLMSGNDAAITIAVHIGGTIEGFAKMMNDRAKELGAHNTNFITPNGLHDKNHYTTAYDLALISREAMANDDFNALVGATYHKTTTGDVIRTFKNKNKTLWQYEGGNGIKTGFTKKAGSCLAFAAKRNGMQLIGVVLNCPSMFPKAFEMLDFGFENYEMKTILKAGDNVAQVAVEFGEKNVLALTAKQDIMVPSSKTSQNNVRLVVELAENIKAPVKKGDALGTVQAWEGDLLLKQTALVAASDVMKLDFGYYLWRLTGAWGQ